MLDGTGDSDGDVEVGAHQAARLPDLIGGGPPAVVGHRAGGADRGVADGVGQVFHQLEVFRRAKPAAAAHDDRRVSDIELGGVPPSSR